jgi:hypothetical protein
VAGAETRLMAEAADVSSPHRALMAGALTHIAPPAGVQWCMVVLAQNVKRYMRACAWCINR